MLLFYLPVILDGLISAKYFNHFKLFSSAIYLLLQTSITQEQLQTADENIKSFVKELQELYDKEHMVMNVHLLTHLVDCVKQNGPLWVYGMFTFESFNAKFKKYLGSSNEVLHTITMKYVLERLIKVKPEYTNNAEKLFSPKEVCLSTNLLTILNQLNICVENSA